MFDVKLAADMLAYYAGETAARLKSKSSPPTSRASGRRPFASRSG
jgi:hypothetical protein